MFIFNLTGVYLNEFICFICRIREVHFSELLMGLCHLLAATRQLGRKPQYFGQ